MGSFPPQGAGFIPSALLAEMSTSQTAIGAATDIDFDTEVEKIGSAISFNTSTGEFTLQPGTYELAAYIRGQTFSNTVAGTLNIRWVDGADAAINKSECQIVPNPSTATGSSQIAAITIITVTVVTIVKVRCNAANGTATVSAGLTRAIVKKLA